MTAGSVARPSHPELQRVTHQSRFTPGSALWWRDVVRARSTAGTGKQVRASNLRPTITRLTVAPVFAAQASTPQMRFAAQGAYVPHHLAHTRVPSRACVQLDARRFMGFMSRVLRRTIRRQDTTFLLHIQGRRHAGMDVACWELEYIVCCCCGNRALAYCCEHGSIYTRMPSYVRPQCATPRNNSMPSKRRLDALI